MFTAGDHQLDHKIYRHKYVEGQKRDPYGPEPYDGPIQDPESQKDRHEDRNDPADPFSHQKSHRVGLVRYLHQTVSLVSQYEQCVSYDYRQNDQLR